MTQASSRSPGAIGSERLMRKNIEAFHSAAWPALEKEGWTKVSEALFLFCLSIKVVQLFGQLGNKQ